MSIRNCFAYLFLALGLTAFSQGSQVSEQRYFSYRYSNDFFNETDRYFTQQIHPELVLKAFRKLPFMKLLPGLKNSVIQYGLSGTQDCYTPASIRRDSILKGDRPFAAVIFLGHFKSANDSAKKQRLISEIDIGAIGPCAKCEEEQKGIHYMLDNLQPLGWENQISNDIYLGYRLRYEKGLLSLKTMDVVGLGEVNVGTIHDNAAIGANIRFGRMQGYFDNTRKRKFQFFLFGQGWVQGVIRNGTLQGGLFSNSINTLSYSEIAPVVLKGSLGANLDWKGFSIEYCRTFITREINTWWAHGWGYLRITGFF